MPDTKTDLIDRAALKRRLENYRRDCEEAEDTAAEQVFADCICELDDAPTVDAAGMMGYEVVDDSNGGESGMAEKEENKGMGGPIGKKGPWGKCPNCGSSKCDWNPKTDRCTCLTCGHVDGMVIPHTKKPRICEVLGVEVRERFDTECYKDAFIERDGTVRTNFRCLMDSDRVCEIINHPDRIIRKPRFTEDEITFARYIKSGCMTNATIERTEGNYLIWKTEDTEEEKMEHLLPYKLFPSIRPGQSVRIEDIVGCGND